MLRRFTTEEADILTICERNGWTYAQWYALPEDEQIDRLAMLYNRRKYLDSVLDMIHRRTDNGLGFEITAFITTLIERYAA